jgi:hypothetical protein
MWLVGNDAAPIRRPAAQLVGLTLGRREELFNGGDDARQIDGLSKSVTTHACRSSP